MVDDDSKTKIEEFLEARHALSFARPTNKQPSTMGVQMKKVEDYLKLTQLRRGDARGVGPPPRATAGDLSDADARVMEREAEAASGSQKELTAFLDKANNSRLRNEVCALPVTYRERILFNQLDAASGMWTMAIPTARTVMTPHELREVAAGDAYWRVHHDAIADAFRDNCVHDLVIAVDREVDDLFHRAVPLGNTVPRDGLKDLMPEAEVSFPAFNVVTGSYDLRSLKCTWPEFETMRYGVKYTAVPRATAVDRFERSMLGDIQRGLAARDAAWHNTGTGQKGSLRDILDKQ
eukprot:jgi/Tetstr1/432304/TSEL_021706.t2